MDSALPTCGPARGEVFAGWRPPTVPGRRSLDGPCDPNRSSPCATSRRAAGGTSGCASAHGGPKYERLVAGDRLVMQLHDWDVAVSKASGVIVAHPAVTAA